jgi:meso-butanediol dehydrogenase/(S,S)-butanediol dehydrogenase/diacetyl reductase
MAKRFEGRIVLVTGAASGIGLEISRQFALEGARVIGTDLNEKELARLAGEDGSPFAATRTSDAGDLGAIAELAAWISEEWGALDVLVNNAGFARLANPEQVTAEDYSAQMSVLLTGPIFLVKHLASLLRASENGSVAHISSASAILSMPGYCPYGVAKAAIAKFAEDCALTVPGVRHNAVLPGFIDTPILASVYGDEAVAAVQGFLKSSCPVPRMGTCRDVSDAVLFLSSDAASYINGTGLVVDGGLTRVHSASALG